MKTIGQARREAGIPESDYLRHGDTVHRIATIRTLVRWFGPPDHRYEHVDDNCSLTWTVDADRRVVVRPDGGITS